MHTQYPDENNICILRKCDNPLLPLRYELNIQLFSNTDGLITKSDSLWNYADKAPPTCCDVGARAYILLVRAFLYRRLCFLGRRFNIASLNRLEFLARIQRALSSTMNRFRRSSNRGIGRHVRDYRRCNLRVRGPNGESASTKAAIKAIRFIMASQVMDNGEPIILDLAVST